MICRNHRDVYGRNSHPNKMRESQNKKVLSRSVDIVAEDPTLLQTQSRTFCKLIARRVRRSEEWKRRCGVC